MESKWQRWVTSDTSATGDNRCCVESFTSVTFDLFISQLLALFLLFFRFIIDCQSLQIVVYVNRSIKSLILDLSSHSSSSFPSVRSSIEASPSFYSCIITSLLPIVYSRLILSIWTRRLWPRWSVFNCEPSSTSTLRGQFLPKNLFSQTPKQTLLCP